MTDADPVRIALVGAGRMGQVHLGALQSSELIALAGVVEPVSATREQLGARGLPVYATVQELLGAGEVDGVLIAAPSDQHPELVAALAAAGLPVLCEKPVGVRVGDAVAATRAAAAAGTLLQVGYWRRFVPELRELGEQIAGGELGEINQIACMQWDAEPPSAQFRSHSGGIAVDMGVHELDQVRWLLGQEIDWVAAAAAGPSSPADFSPADPDAATVLAALSGGATATISLGRRFPHADSCWVEVFGTSGYRRVPFMWDVAGEQVFRDAMVSQAEAFARAIRDRRSDAADGGDAIAALVAAELIADALLQSSERASQPQSAAR